MGNTDFHTNKAEEFIKSLYELTENCNFENVKSAICLNLFYLGLHIIDWYLAEKGYEELHNHGDRNNKLRNINPYLFDVWNSFFRTSNDQRYNELTEDSHIQTLLEDLEEIVEAIKSEFPNFTLYEYVKTIIRIIEEKVKR